MVVQNELERLRKLQEELWRPLGGGATGAGLGIGMCGSRSL